MRLPARVENATTARARFPRDADRLFDALYEMDPLADACADALAQNRGEAEGWIAAGCAGHDLAEAPRAVREYFETAGRMPSWVDWERVDRAGRLFFRAGPAGGITLGAKALVGGYCSPGGNKPLAFSGALEGQVSRRLAETGRFVVATNTPGALRPGGEAWAITLRVRLMHAQVRRLLLRSERWKSELWGAPINQHDMAATSLLFSVVFLSGIRQFGVPVSQDEAEDYVHAWRVSGWLMGVREDLLPRSEAEGLALGELIQLTQGPPDEDGRRLVAALLESPRGAMQGKPGASQIEGWQIAMGRGFCRTLVGPQLADELALPTNGWRFVIPTVRAGVAVARKVLPASVRDPERWEARGRKYWERNVEVGLQGTPAKFALPGALGGRYAAR
ncbi:MAG: DUF2236 domain-containing protein [Sandaracinus sp.]|nr:DUF2236 domain-containing protein [Sandaracinus sp.]